LNKSNGTILFTKDVFLVGEKLVLYAMKILSQPERVPLKGKYIECTKYIGKDDPSAEIAKPSRHTSQALENILNSIDTTRLLLEIGRKPVMGKGTIMRANTGFYRGEKIFVRFAKKHKQKVKKSKKHSGTGGHNTQKIVAEADHTIGITVAHGEIETTIVPKRIQKTPTKILRSPKYITPKKEMV